MEEDVRVPSCVSSTLAHLVYLVPPLLTRLVQCQCRKLSRSLVGQGYKTVCRRQTLNGISYPNTSLYYIKPRDVKLSWDLIFGSSNGDVCSDLRNLQIKCPLKSLHFTVIVLISFVLSQSMKTHSQRMSPASTPYLGLMFSVRSSSINLVFESMISRVLGINQNCS